MMIYAESRPYRQRAAAFDARMGRAAAMRKGAADMTAIATGEPQPSDAMMLHDPMVSPDLRAAIVDARKRMWMMSPDDRLAFRDAISPLADAIQDLIDRCGFKYTPLMRLISPRSMPNKLSQRAIENNNVGAKLAKFEGAPHSCDLNYLIDPRIPGQLRRELIEAKNALDAAPRGQRHALSKSFASGLLRRVDALRDVIGRDGVCALRRVLASD